MRNTRMLIPDDREMAAQQEVQGAAPAAERNEQIEALYRSDSRRILATLIRLLGDFDLAEEALHDAFTIALHTWPRDGVPQNPRSWLISTGRYKAIDRLRRSARFNAASADLADQLEATASSAADYADDTVHGLEDDRLRLIFTCCHPALRSEEHTSE